METGILPQIDPQIGPTALVISVFVAVAAVTFSVYYAFIASRGSVKSEVKRRLQRIALGNPSDDIMPALLKDEMMSDIPPLHRVLFKMAVARRVETLIDQADLKVKVGLVFLFSGTMFMLSTAFFRLFLHRGFFLSVALAILPAAAPFIIIARKRTLRFRKFTEQFPDTLDMIARSLRAGHSFTSAMQVVSQEMPDPVAKVFRIAHEEQTLGLSVPESLDNMTKSITTLDLRFFITAVNIQRESGGNLSEILEKLGQTIRERFRILGQLRIYTAQGRLSGYILAALPVVMVFVLMVLNPSYLKILFQNKVGIYMVVTALFLQVVGFLVIRKIINIKI
jgi:tight adherence protein B